MIATIASDDALILTHSAHPGWMPSRCRLGSSSFRTWSRFGSNSIASEEKPVTLRL